MLIELRVYEKSETRTWFHSIFLNPDEFSSCMRMKKQDEIVSHSYILTMKNGKEYIITDGEISYLEKFGYMRRK